MKTVKTFCLMFMIIFTSFICLKSTAFAQDIENMLGHWKSVDTLPPYGEHEYFFIGKDTFVKRKQKPAPVKITEKDNYFIFTVSEGKMKGMPFAKIKPINKNTIHSIRGVSVEFKRITKDEYERELLSLK